MKLVLRPILGTFLNFTTEVQVAEISSPSAVQHDMQGPARSALQSYTKRTISYLSHHTKFYFFYLKMFCLYDFWPKIELDHGPCLSFWKGITQPGKYLYMGKADNRLRSCQSAF